MLDSDVKRKWGAGFSHKKGAEMCGLDPHPLPDPLVYVQ